MLSRLEFSTILYPAISYPVFALLAVRFAGRRPDTRRVSYLGRPDGLIKGLGLVRGLFTRLRQFLARKRNPDDGMDTPVKTPASQTACTSGPAYTSVRSESSSSYRYLHASVYLYRSATTPLSERIKDLKPCSQTSS